MPVYSFGYALIGCWLRLPPIEDASASIRITRYILPDARARWLPEGLAEVGSLPVARASIKRPTAGAMTLLTSFEIELWHGSRVRDGKKAWVPGLLLMHGSRARRGNVTLVCVLSRLCGSDLPGCRHAAHVHILWAPRPGPMYAAARIAYNDFTFAPTVAPKCMIIGPCE